VRPHGLQLRFLARTAPMLQTEPAQGERASERGVRGLRGEEAVSGAIRGMRDRAQSSERGGGAPMPEQDRPSIGETEPR